MFFVTVGMLVQKSAYLSEMLWFLHGFADLFMCCSMAIGSSWN